MQLGEDGMTPSPAHKAVLSLRSSCNEATSPSHSAGQYLKLSPVFQDIFLTVVVFLTAHIIWLGLGVQKYAFCVNRLVRLFVFK